MVRKLVNLFCRLFNNGLSSIPVAVSLSDTELAIVQMHTATLSN